MPKCLKCDLDNVPEDHALRCPMRDHICPTYCPPTTYPYWTNPVWTIAQPQTGTTFYHTTCGSGCNHT